MRPSPDEVPARASAQGTKGDFMNFQAVRGTSDLLPSDLKHWRRIERRATAMAELYGYQEIRTPLFEKADLFVKGLGVMSGLVERDLWVFHDKHGQKLALRPEMTPSVVRAVLQHKMHQEPEATKLYYNSPVFLLGKEGGEPSRQSHQFGLEILGVDNASADAELMSFAYDLCYGLGFNEDEITIELNTLGCSKCRAAFQDALREFCNSRQGELCGSCKRKYRNHPTWVLSCPEASCSALANVAPTTLGYLCVDCKGHFNQLKLTIKDLGLNVVYNPRVVRDNEYYSKSAFRVSVLDRVVASGGRYDRLFQDLGGSEIPAVGIAFSVDELSALLPVMEDVPEELDVSLWGEGEETSRFLVTVCQKLRRQGLRAEITHHPKGPNPNARYQVRLLENELYRGRAEVYDLYRRQTERVAPEKLSERLEYLLGLQTKAVAVESSHSSNNGAGQSSGSRRRLVRRTREQSERALEASSGKDDAGDELLNEEQGSDDADRGESLSSRRRRRRRRKRNETSVNIDAVETDVFDEETEPEAEAELEEIAAEPTSEAGGSRGRRRGRGRDRNRSHANDEVETTSVQPVEDDYADEVAEVQEPAGRRGRSGRPERNQPAKSNQNDGNHSSRHPEPRVESEPSKTFIPRFLVGSTEVIAPAPVMAVEQKHSKVSGPLPTFNPGGALNWSVPNKAELVSSPADDAGDDAQSAPRPYARSRGRRR
jgi:histidyl-tRNA synthetase